MTAVIAQMMNLSADVPFFFFTVSTDVWESFSVKESG